MQEEEHPHQMPLFFWAQMAQEKRFFSVNEGKNGQTYIIRT